MHREFIRRQVMAGRPAASDEAIEGAIEEAIRLLANLIHYQGERSHYDDDIAFVARVLLAEKK